MKWHDQPVPFVPEEAPVKVISFWAVGLFGLMVFAMIAATFFWRKDVVAFWAPYRGGTTAPFSQRQAPRNDAPRLQVDETADINAYRAKQNLLLNEYAWIDKSAGTVRIPIEQAMKRLLERGLPTRGSTGK